MRGLIYFLKDNDFVEMNEEGRQEERLSQELLAQRPILFTGDGISGQPPRRHLLVSGQVPVPAMQGAPGQWRLDLFFWQKMEANLKTGVAQMTYMSDNLPREIIRIIDFLKEHSDTSEVTALELRQYLDKDKTAFDSLHDRPKPTARSRP